MKLLFILLFAGVSQFCKAQTIDSLPPDSVLYNNLIAYHQQLQAAQLQEFEISTKGNWMNYVPSVGIGYAPQGQPRPAVSFSLAQVFTAQRNRETIEAKRRAIVATADLLLQSEIQALQALFRQLQILESDAEFAESIHQIDKELFKLYEAQYQNNEMLASQFLFKKRDMLTKEQSLKKIKNTIEDKKIEILRLSRHNIVKNQ